MVKHLPGADHRKTGRSPTSRSGQISFSPGIGSTITWGHFEQRSIQAGDSSCCPTEPRWVRHPKPLHRRTQRGRRHTVLGFDGIVCSDRMTQVSEKFFRFVTTKEASDWGVEHLTIPDRCKMSIDAGVDQFGGQTNPETIIALFASGSITEDRIDDSARRILRLKFEMGPFNDPYVDERASATATGAAVFTNAAGTPTLPLTGRPRLYVRGINKKTAAHYCIIASSPKKAAVAFISTPSPTERRIRKEIRSLFFAEGDLRFSRRRLKRTLKVCNRVPTIVSIRIDRPAVIPEITDEASAVFASFDLADDVLLDGVFDSLSPACNLPVEVPASIGAVVRSDEDVPGTENPVLPHGRGHTHEGWDPS